MKKLILITFVFTTFVSAYSQEISTPDSLKEMTVYDIQRNFLYVSTHILTIDAFYERIIPIKDKTGLLVGAGIIQGVAFSTATNPVVKFGCMFGGYKHFFEAGIVIAPLKNDLNLLLPLVGYRYQHPKGFFLRIDVMLAFDSGTAKDGSGEEWVEAIPLPGFAIGYSF